MHGQQNIKILDNCYKILVEFNDSTLPWPDVSKKSEAVRIKFTMTFFIPKEYKLTNNGVQSHDASSNFPWNLSAGSWIITDKLLKYKRSWI